MTSILILWTMIRSRNRERGVREANLYLGKIRRYGEGPLRDTERQRERERERAKDVHINDLLTYLYTR